MLPLVSMYARARVHHAELVTRRRGLLIVHRRRDMEVKLVDRRLLGAVMRQPSRRHGRHRPCTRDARHGETQCTGSKSAHYECGGYPEFHVNSRRMQPLDPLFAQARRQAGGREFAVANVYSTPNVGSGTELRQCRSIQRGKLDA